MRVSHFSDNDGAVCEKVEYDLGEPEAIKRAYEIVEARCAEAGVALGREQRELLGWCFDGALRIGGIPELIRYATEAKIAGKKTTVSSGYAGVQEMEVLR